MTLLRANDRLFYFAHIPKTGGSSVETALRAAGASRALHYHKRLKYLRCNLQHMHADLFDTFVPPAFYDAGFCVTRHPVARLVSEYRWRQTLQHASIPFDAWVRKQIKDYRKDPYILDNHMRPQAEFVGKKIEILRFEDGMDQVLSRVSQITGLTLDPGTHVRQPTIKDALTWSPETRAAALRFYDVDFATFGYDYDTPLTDLSIAREDPALPGPQADAPVAPPDAVR